MSFDLDGPLLLLLRDRRERQRRDHLASSPRPNISAAAAAVVQGMQNLQLEVEDAHDAFLLDPGMGPMVYLTAKGHVLIDGRSWDGEPLREASEDEAIAALVVGARKTGIAELVDLIPHPPADAVSCPMCKESRYAEIVEGCEMVCPLCRGRGWALPSMLDRPIAKKAIT
jgi:hypothetical protein